MHDLTSTTTCCGSSHTKPSVTPAGCPTGSFSLTLSTWRRLRPRTQVKGSVPETAPSPLETPVSSPGCPLCLCPTGYRSGVPTTPSGWINLLEQLMEFRRLDYRFIIKGYNLGTSRWKKCMGEAWGVGEEFPRPLLGTTLPQFHGITSPEAL